MAQWFESQLNNFKVLEPDSFLAEKLAIIKHDTILAQITSIIDTHPDIALESVEHLVKTASQKRIRQLVDLLNAKLEETQKVDQETSDNDKEYGTKQKAPK